MKKVIVKILLWILNSSFLNPTPCSYAFVGNIDNFSRDDIESNLQMEPEMSLRGYLDIADRFKASPISRIGITAIESDGSYTENVEPRF